MARNRHDDQYYALKTLHANRDVELQGIREFKRRSNEHQHLIQIGHVGKSQDCYYYVMPLADNAFSNKSLRDAREYEPVTLESHVDRKGFMRADAALLLAAQILAGLEDLHQHGAMHRDVKPANILRFSDRWVLGDPGLTGPVNDDSEPAGTEGFVNEQLANSQRGDLYALGITLKQVVKPDVFTSSQPSCRYLEKVINRALCVDEQQQYHSSVEMRRDVEDAVRVTSRPGLPLRKWCFTLLVASLVLSLPFAFRLSNVWENREKTVETLRSSSMSAAKLGVVNVQVKLNSARYGPVLFGPLAASALEFDRVKLELTVDRPAYLCVVAFDANGKANIVPEGDWIDRKESHLSFPRSEFADAEYELDAVGVQAFAVIGSDERIDRASWQSQLGKVSWSSFQWKDAEYWWWNSGRRGYFRQLDRGQVRRLQPPDEFAELQATMSRLDDVSLLYLCMFPVEKNQAE